MNPPELKFRDCEPNCNLSLVLFPKITTRCEAVLEQHEMWNETGSSPPPSHLNRSVSICSGSSLVPSLSPKFDPS